MSRNGYLAEIQNSLREEKNKTKIFLFNVKKKFPNLTSEINMQYSQYNTQSHYEKKRTK